jgi:hypothetical protein
MSELVDFNAEEGHEESSKFVRVVENNVPMLREARKAQSGEINVTFEYAAPSEAYYHTIK